jgi:hypothetical protein
MATVAVRATGQAWGAVRSAGDLRVRGTGPAPAKAGAVLAGRGSVDADVPRGAGVETADTSPARAAGSTVVEIPVPETVQVLGRIPVDGSIQVPIAGDR